MKDRSLGVKKICIIQRRPEKREKLRNVAWLGKMKSDSDAFGLLISVRSRRFRKESNNGSLYLSYFCLERID